MNYIRIVICSFLFIYSPFFLRAQSLPDSARVDISNIQFSKIIGEYAFMEIRNVAVPADSIPSMAFSQKLPQKFSISVPYEMVGKTVYLKFFLHNPADTAIQVYFFPGFYYQNADMFTALAANVKESFAAVKPLPENDSNYYSGLSLLSVGPKETRAFFAKLVFVKTPVNFLSPRIVNKGFVYYFKSGLHTRKSNIDLLTYLVSGILLMMIFYSLAVYLQNFNSEFLYYAGYAFFTGSLLFLKSYLFSYSTPFNFIFEGYLDFIMQGVGYIFYFIFIGKFLDAKQNHPFLEKLLRFGEWAVLLLLVAFSFMYFFTPYVSILNIIENGTKQLLIVLGIVFIIYGIRAKNKLMNYLVAGQAMLILFGAISILLILNPFLFVKPQNGKNNILNDALLYYEVGLILELICFLSGLAYKNKRDIIERVKERERLKLENERQEFDKQVAVLEAKQEERNRISADMHDELGSGVTAIRLMSEIVKAKMKDQTLPEIEKISFSANELLNKMNTIIWTMISSNDSVESLVAYIRAYAVEFFENTRVDCHINISAIISPKELSGEKRRNIFLSVKEAMNNVLKHSQASNVTISISTHNQLVIEIADDGTGINTDKLRKFGNGMNNMRKRIESINGELTIENKQGTTITFKLKL